MFTINGRPVSGMLLGSHHVAKAVMNARFFDEMPEFAKLKADFQISKDDGSMRVGLNVDKVAKFFEVVAGLPRERMPKFMEFAGIFMDADMYAEVRNTDGRITLAKIYEVRPDEVSEKKIEPKEEGMNTAATKNKPGVMLGGAHISKAVSDPGFFRTMPEFASVKAQIDTMHIDVNSKKGCNSCNKRRLHANIDGNFAAIASRLPYERAKVLKKYLGIEEDRPFFIRAINPADRKLILRQF